MVNENEKEGYDDFTLEVDVDDDTKIFSTVEFPKHKGMDAIHALVYAAKDSYTYQIAEMLDGEDDSITTALNVVGRTANNGGD